MSTSATKNLTAQDYFSTTLSAGITSSTTTIPLNSVPSGSEGFLVIDPDNVSKEIIFYNAKSSSDVTVPTTGDRGRGGTSAVSHSSGATVKMMVNSDYVKEMQNGHAMGDAFLTPNHLVASTGTSWAWQSWTPSYTNITVGNGTVVAKYVQIGKSVLARYSLTLGTTSSVGTDPTVSLPVTANSGYVAGDIMGQFYAEDTGGYIYDGFLWFATTTTATLKMKDPASYVRNLSITSSVPFIWGNTDKIHLSFQFEAA